MTTKKLIQSLITHTKIHINKRRGWRTDRKIIVIESDDWGSIRMPNKEVYDKSLKQGIRVDICPYNKYDTLASKNDLTALYDILLRHKDSNGKHPVITANTIMANPDFAKIKESNFNEYHFESFIKTLENYPNRSFKLWEQGLAQDIFYPQLHGREHINIHRWIQALQRGSKEMGFAFDNFYFGISKTISKENNPSFMAALDYDNESGKNTAVAAVDEAAKMFEKVFGFKSKTFIAPNYYWDENIEAVLRKNDIMFLQGGFAQNKPLALPEWHYLGERNNYNQTYLTRNVKFEPSSNKNKDWVNDALLEIQNAFKLNKPAIINSHRVNFIGSIFEENRTRNLRLLDKLLKEIIKIHPAVEFMNSAQLSEIIEHSKI